MVETLRVAVPMWIDHLRHLPGPGQLEAVRLAWAKNAADQVAHRGDVLQYGGKRGEAAEVFNHLAKGLAAAAFQPGGVTFAGEHWEVTADDLLCVGTPVRPQPVVVELPDLP